MKDGLEEETFEHHKSGLIADKLEKDPSLSYQTGDYWSQIVDKRYNFFLASSAAMDHLELVCNKVLPPFQIIKCFEYYFNVDYIRSKMR